MSTTKTLSVAIDTPYDESPDVSWLDQTPKQLGSLEAAVANRRRRKSYDAGDWHLIGVRLRAEVVLASNDDVPNPTWRTNTLALTTPGLWGVESDSDAEYVRDIARDEADYLREDLLALGFSAEEVDEAIADAVSGR